MFFSSGETLNQYICKSILIYHKAISFEKRKDSSESLCPWTILINFLFISSRIDSKNLLFNLQFIRLFLLSLSLSWYTPQKGVSTYPVGKERWIIISKENHLMHIETFQEYASILIEISLITYSHTAHVFLNFDHHASRHRQTGRIWWWRRWGID